MPDVDTNALRRAKTLREEINTRTGVADTTVTEGVKRLLRNSGTEVAIQHEASMMLDIYPDPIIAREEFSRMMDYGDDIAIGHYNVTEEDRYIELLYLENPGNAKVDTGFIPDVTTDKLHIKYEIVDYRTDGIWPGIAKVQTLSNGTGANFGINYYTRDPYNHISGSSYGKIYDIWTGAGITTESVTDDGRTVSGNHVEATTTDAFTKTFQLFYRNNNTDGSANTSCYGRVRIYECEIYRNDVLIHNYIPKIKMRVRSVENIDTGHIDEYILSETYGYHDEIDDIFLTSTGSDALRKGPYKFENIENDYIFKPIEYLGFTSSQVIYTDFVINGTQKFMMDIQINNNYASGISNWANGGFISGKSNSSISTRTTGKISVNRFLVDNIGRGSFGEDYKLGEIYAYNQIENMPVHSIENPNRWWFMIGCLWEQLVEYYHMTGNLYGFELYDNSITKVKDMKPMEITTKGGYVINYGLYDSINKLLYVAGKGTLQKGPYIN